MAVYDKKTIENLIEARLGLEKLLEMMRSFKDPDRFDKYLSILQERVPWEDKILLPYGLHLYIVRKQDGSRVVKCDCGHEFGDSSQNWKLKALIYVRDNEEKLNEIYPKLLHSDPEWMILREYYCPGCYTQLDVEAVPPGYPVIFDFEPDIDTFYKEWLGRPCE